MSVHIRRALDIFWSEHVWLPPNTTWADLAPNASTQVRHTDHRDLLYPLPMAVGMLLLRYLLEKYWFAPVGVSLGIKNVRPKSAPYNPVLEKAYLQCKKFTHKKSQGLAKQAELTERQVERWLRLRRAQDRPSALVKFCENSWRCLYYTSSFIFGLVVLWDKPWLWSINECWNGFPHQNITDEIWWYYMVSMSFYCSLMVSQFFDVKRKDFWQMFLHHVATIVLICFSWVVNLTRIGSLVLVVHDCADIFLEAAKMAKYGGYQKFFNSFFIIFTVVWIITRLGFYPFWIIRSTSIEAPKLLPMFPAYYIFNSLLLILLGLHIFWTYLILRMVYGAFYGDQVQGDIRSDSSNFSEDSKSH